MISIGSLENNKITTGPKFFDVDLNDEHEFPSPGNAASVHKKSQAVDDVNEVKNKPKKLSKERRLKTKGVPLAFFSSARTLYRHRLR